MDHASIPLGLLEMLGRIGLAVLAGALIGFDRELQKKPAGLRTHALVSLGACVFTLISALASAAPTLDEAAPGRIVQGIVAGVGFIGAGAIFRRGDSATGQGLTTAATIWIVAAVGTAAGLGLWRMALVATAASLVILMLENPIDRLLKKREPGTKD